VPSVGLFLSQQGTPGGRDPGLHQQSAFEINLRRGVAFSSGAKGACQS